MIKLAELEGPSCLTSAADDEPLFVLRANDECAPGTVRQWVHAYVQSKGGYGRMTKKQRAKADEAYAVARQMEEWKELRETERLRALNIIYFGETKHD